jgi:hypothetical protein
MRLIAYRIKKRVRIEPAPSTRAWMDAWPRRNPYHCLPLAVANSYGWQLLCKAAFNATWTGQHSKRSVIVTPAGRKKSGIGYSHFGGGILTFDADCLLRTTAPTELFVCGPLNACKHGVSALSAIVETSWSMHTFTMNWRFTAPDITVRFDEGEPFCQFFPIVPNTIDGIEPEIHDLDADPQLYKCFNELRLSRQLSNGLRLTAEGVLETGEHQYQHHYHNATTAHGERLAPKPRRRFTVRPFLERGTVTPESHGTDLED